MGSADTKNAPVGGEQEPEEARMQCDFCGEYVASVQRVALDGDYERLRTRHRTQYACPSCSESKERSRLDREHG